MVTKSIVFLLLVSDRVWSTKVTQRPLQSSDSSAPKNKNNVTRQLTRVHFYVSVFSPLYAPAIRVLICV